MARNKLKRISIFLFCLTIIIIIIFGTMGILLFRKIEMPISASSFSNKNEALQILYKEYDKDNNVKSNSYYKNFLEKDLKVGLYFYKERSIPKYNGLCYATIRLIVIDEDITGYQYCVTLTHEIMHLKRFILQENYVCFETFKYLYESKELHNVGVWYALMQLDGAYSGEYNICYQIVDYLTNK